MWTGVAFKEKPLKFLLERKWGVSGGSCRNNEEPTNSIKWILDDEVEQNKQTLIANFERVVEPESEHNIQKLVRQFG